MNGNARGDLGWLTARPIAHRGLHNKASGIIENSHSAFAAAITHDYAIECDLQISGDGEAMVFHDKKLDRLTGQTGHVNQLSADHLGQITLAGSNDRPQTLQQMLEQVDGAVPLIIELKSHWDGSERLAMRACKILEQYHGRAALMSFDPVAMAAVAKFAPALIRGGVAGLFEPARWPELPPDLAEDLRTGAAMDRSDPDFMSYSVQALDGPFAKRFRAGGKPVLCWTVRDRETAERALKLCDQITFEGFRA
jgi:glycerophosphoryl diester phosphodiesterase